MAQENIKNEYSDFIEQMKFDETRGFLPKGYTDEMIKKIGWRYLE